MTGTLDKQVIEKFKEFQQETGKYSDLDIEKVEFEKKILKDVHQSNKVTTQKNTTADKFIEIGDIDRVTKKYNISNKIKPNLPEKGKHAPKGTILISRVRPLLGGYTIINGDDYTFTSGDLNPIVLLDEIDVNYAFKIICSSKFKIFLKNNQNNSGQKPTITKKLYDFDLSIPKKFNNYSSKDIQKIIVEYLEFWKTNYTDLYRNSIHKQKPILRDIKRILVAKTFQHDETIGQYFNNFAKKNNYRIKFDDILFEKVKIFENEDYFTTNTPTLGYSQKNLIYNENGYGVYSGKKDIISKGIYNKNKLIDASKSNIKISFATDGEASAGTNFAIHDTPFYVNATRMVLNFTEKGCPKYFYYSLLNMKKIYKFNYSKKANMTHLIEVETYMPNNSNIGSVQVQQYLVEFWEMVFSNITNIFENFTYLAKLIDSIDEAFLYRTFNKIIWRNDEN